MKMMTVSEARARLPRILDLVEEGNEVSITRHGRPVAVVVRPDRLGSPKAESIMEAARRLHNELESAREAPLTATRMAEERAEELIAELRADRSRP